MIEAKAIADSQGPTGEHTRLLTIRGIAPTMIHQETLRHRLIYIEDALGGDFDFSFSVSSTRAIPVRRTLADVRANPARPVKWGAEQKGMVPGDELSAPFLCPDGLTRTPDEAWNELVRLNTAWAEAYADAGHHKSTCNRIISTYNHTHALMTATTPGWMNFFGLRLDSAADPTLRALAEACWRVWNESQPQKLEPGQWHLPFMDDEYGDEIRRVINYDSGHGPEDQLEVAKKVSVACSAHLSYESFEPSMGGGRMTLSHCVALHDRFLKTSPLHASPFEHQATPDSRIQIPYMRPIGIGGGRFEVDHYESGGWINPKEAGNLGLGWRQYRKMLPGESLAPLPEAYR